MSEQGQRLLEQEERDGVIARAEQILGYEFEDKELLAKALTHPSCVEDEKVELSYERLEFLGDAFLGFTVASEVYRRFPDMDEGGMTRLKSAVVSGTTLSKVAYDLGFSDIIVVGNSERGTHGRGLRSALENVYESVVAALMLDGGEGLARDWILRTVGPYITEDLAEHPTNPKSALQELLQDHGEAPEYEVIATYGPPHDRSFDVEVRCQGKVLGKGSGRSKKEAEAEAARNAIRVLSDGDRG